MKTWKRIVFAALAVLFVQLAYSRVTGDRDWTIGFGDILAIVLAAVAGAAVFTVTGLKKEK